MFKTLYQIYGIIDIKYYFLTDTICLTVSVLSSVYSFSLFSRDSVASLESFSFSTRCFDSSFNCCSTSSRRCTVDCLSLTSLKYNHFLFFKSQQNEFNFFYPHKALFISTFHPWFF